MATINASSQGGPYAAIVAHELIKQILEGIEWIVF